MLRTIITTLIAASTAVILLVWLAGCGLTEPPGTAVAAESTPKAVAAPDTTAKAKPISAHLAALFCVAGKQRVCR